MYHWYSTVWTGVFISVGNVKRMWSVDWTALFLHSLYISKHDWSGLLLAYDTCKKLSLQDLARCSSVWAGAGIVTPSSPPPGFLLLGRSGLPVSPSSPPYKWLSGARGEMPCGAVWMLPALLLTTLLQPSVSQVPPHLPQIWCIFRRSRFQR